ARARANPYETIKSGIFQNRAAMKTANLDRIFGWRLSQEFDDTVRGSKNPFKEHQERKNDSRHQSAFYFVDVCAGPGGFSEYMLWRKAFYNAKGFGFTLKGPDDFKLWKFKAASSAYFDPFYGKNEDGNIMAPENLE
uniref:Cap-specific mRNA (nucleoside-2'-O-)-methyltransferase 1 n=1 Tax=Acrobeloides nanus TaxID=290746 RepID=A0A914D828_9BILA